MHQNFSKINWFNFTWSFLLIQPVVVPFFKSRGLSLPEIFSVQTAFSLTLSFLDIPTGYLSDLLGRRVSLISASILKGLGGVALCFSTGWGQIVLSYVVIGIANSLMSGSDIALLYESLDSSEPKESLDSSQPKKSISTAKIFGNRLFFSLTGGTVSALLGGLVAHWSLELAVVCNAIFAWLPFLIGLGLKDVPRNFSKPQKNLKRDFKSLVNEIYKARNIVVAAIIFSAGPVLSLYIFQSMWSESSYSYTLMGFFSASFGLLSAASAKFAAKLESQLGTRKTFLLIALTPVMAFLGASGLPVAFVFFLGLAIEFQRGLSQTIFMKNLNETISGDLRASINSVVSFGSRMVVAVSGPILGFIGARWNLQISLLALGLFYLSIFIFLMRGLFYATKTRRFS